MEWDTFTSDDETFSFDYPKDGLSKTATEDIPVRPTRRQHRRRVSQARQRRRRFHRNRAKWA